MEENRMKPEAMNIIKMVSKPPHERMPFEGVELTKFVQKMPFFRRFFPYQSEKFISFCLTAEYLELQPGEDLYAREDSPDYIYVLVEGGLQVQNTETKVAREVKAYDMVGQVETVFRMQARGQQAQVLVETHCMVFSGSSFRKVWDCQEQVDKAYKYLLSNKYFQALTAYDRRSMSLLMIKHSFWAGEQLVSAGVPCQSVLFMIYGEVQVVRVLNLGNKPTPIVLETLEEMASFGEYESINGLDSEVTLVAVAAGTYYTINMGELVEIRHRVVELVRQRGLPYPDAEELQFRLQVQADVDRVKREVRKKLRG